MANARENRLLLSELLNRLEGEPLECLQRYFNTAPDWVLEALVITNFQKDTEFIREETVVDMIYILAEGIVKAIDYRFLGNSYDYMWFYPVKSFGGMEILLELEHYQTTLSTITPCTMLVIPRTIFERWIKSDMSILSMEVKTMGSFLLEEVKRERVFLFMEGSERLSYTLMRIFEHTENNHTCTIRLSQQDLADSTGLSAKTVSRSLRELENGKLIKRSGNKIILEESGYQRMKELLRQKTDI
jgi:CRP/FNR family cyclic AMP-dependent transcriptional regulator